MSYSVYYVFTTWVSSEYWQLNHLNDVHIKQTYPYFIIVGEKYNIPFYSIHSPFYLKHALLTTEQYSSEQIPRATKSSLILSPCWVQKDRVMWILNMQHNNTQHQGGFIWKLPKKCWRKSSQCLHHVSTFPSLPFFTGSFCTNSV